jgi:hypothetical protein
VSPPVRLCTAPTVSLLLPSTTLTLQRPVSRNHIRSSNPLITPIHPRPAHQPSSRILLNRDRGGHRLSRQRNLLIPILQQEETKGRREVLDGDGVPKRIMTRVIDFLRLGLEPLRKNHDDDRLQSFPARAVPALLGFLLSPDTAHGTRPFPSLPRVLTKAANRAQSGGPRQPRLAQVAARLQLAKARLLVRRLQHSLDNLARRS